MTIDAAKSILADLELKLGQARGRKTEAETAIKELAFDAHTGDAEARKRLDKLNTEARRHEDEARSLNDAIIEARKRIAAAEAAQADIEERAKAEKVLALLDQFATRGAALDAKLAEFVAEYEALSRDFIELDRLGHSPTTYQAFAKAMQTATATKLQFSDLRQQFLAPAARRDFIEVIASWSESIRRRAMARLNAGRKEAA